ncbi:hypothetical protein COBT_002520 [Conglomerata obtusa]
MISSYTFKSHTNIDRNAISAQEHYQEIKNVRTQKKNIHLKYEPKRRYKRKIRTTQEKKSATFDSNIRLNKQPVSGLRPKIGTNRTHIRKLFLNFHLKTTNHTRENLRTRSRPKNVEGVHLKDIKFINIVHDTINEQKNTYNNKILTTIEDKSMRNNSSRKIEKAKIYFNKSNHILTIKILDQNYTLNNADKENITTNYTLEKHQGDIGTKIPTNFTDVEDYFNNLAKISHLGRANDFFNGVSELQIKYVNCISKYDIDSCDAGQLFLELKNCCYFDVFQFKQRWNMYAENKLLVGLLENCIQNSIANAMLKYEEGDINAEDAKCLKHYLNMNPFDLNNSYNETTNN